jgi:hypothetical protein
MTSEAGRARQSIVSRFAKRGTLLLARGIVPRAGMVTDEDARSLTMKPSEAMVSYLWASIVFFDYHTCSLVPCQVKTSGLARHAGQFLGSSGSSVLRWLLGTLSPNPGGLPLWANSMVWARRRPPVVRRTAFRRVNSPTLLLSRFPVDPVWSRLRRKTRKPA